MLHPYSSRSIEAECPNDTATSYDIRIQNLVRFPTIGDSPSTEAIPKAIATMERVRRPRSSESPFYSDAISHV